MDIHRADGIHCYGTATFVACDLGTVEGPGSIDLLFPHLDLLPGCYTISAGVHRDDGQEPYDYHLSAYPFSVISGLRDLGIAYLDHRWEHQPAASLSDPPEALAARG